MVGSEKVIVAHGVAMLDMKENHCKKIDDKKYMVVQVDDCEEEYKNELLPVRTQYFEFLDDARGSYIERPRNLVLISQDKANIPNRKTDTQKNLSGATNESAIYQKRPFSPQKAPPRISVKCKKMQLLVERSVEDEICIPFDPKTDFFILEASTNAEVHICAEDVNQLLRGELLSVSVVKVFIIALKRHYNDQNFASIGFMCSSFISSSQWEGKSSIEKDIIVRYLTNAMQRYKSKRFILCPYWERHHWVLLVVCLEKREIYLFDPTVNDREIAIKPHLNKAFLSYIQLGPKRTSNKAELKWINGKCAQQTGSVESGYFVMRCILEVVLHHRDSDNLIQDFARTEAYTEDEIHEVLDIWAKQIFVLMHWRDLLEVLHAKTSSK